MRERERVGGGGLIVTCHHGPTLLWPAARAPLHQTAKPESSFGYTGHDARHGRSVARLGSSDRLPHRATACEDLCACSCACWLRAACWCAVESDRHSAVHPSECRLGRASGSATYLAQLLRERGRERERELWRQWMNTQACKAPNRHSPRSVSLIIDHFARRLLGPRQPPPPPPPFHSLPSSPPLLTFVRAAAGRCSPCAPIDHDLFFCALCRYPHQPIVIRKMRLGGSVLIVALSGAAGATFASAAQTLNNVTSLHGTWASGSGNVTTGLEFFDPASASFRVPSTSGLAYSFTDDGFFEQSKFIYQSNCTSFLFSALPLANDAP